MEGNTYGIRAQLKALGAVWDQAGRVWRIAPEKAAQAQALMDGQPEEPKERGEGSGETGALDVDALPDPFDEEPEPLVALRGSGFAVKEALRALGAHWDKEQRAWVIRGSKAARAQALIEAAGKEAAGES